MLEDNMDWQGKFIRRNPKIDSEFKNRESEWKLKKYDGIIYETEYKKAKHKILVIQHEP